MLRPRVIPCLLLDGTSLVKTRQFGDASYVGDPINAVHIFNEKETDEVVILDISATVAGRPPDLGLIEKIASECFMPVAYGGGITSVDQMQAIFRVGIEKVVLNTAALLDPSLVRRAAEVFGSQSIVGAVDARRTRPGVWDTFTHSGTSPTGLAASEAAGLLRDAGAGELLLTSIDREGTGGGYDLELVDEVTRTVDIPVVANGGAADLDDISQVIAAGASAAAVGSMVVYHGRNRAVLISFPSSQSLRDRGL